MYHHLQGKLTHLSPAQAVLEAGGVGYRLTISLTTFRALPPVGALCSFLVHLAVRDDALLLYGFATEAERALFRALLSVTGIGPATAIQILSGSTPEALVAAIRGQDHSFLKKIKGIGEKTARRIILELKDASALYLVASEGAPMSGTIRASQVATAARQALEALGLTSREAAARVDKTLAARPDLSLEETIRSALQ
ncbi:MAG: Holliday junction branch migration protein RuvA [Planctomycetota bacterium]